MIRLAFGLFIAFWQSGLFVKGTFHKGHGQPYHFENSFRGIRWAAAHAFKRIDLDLNITKDGVIVNTHWLRPLAHDGFRDKAGLIRSKQTAVNQMTLAEIQRLVADGGYVIHTLDEALRECARARINPKLEPKADHRFENPAIWKPVKAQCDHLGLRVSGYSIRNLGGKGAGVRRVAAMRQAGIPAAVIR